MQNLLIFGTTNLMRGITQVLQMFFGLFFLLLFFGSTILVYFRKILNFSRFAIFPIIFLY